MIFSVERETNKDGSPYYDQTQRFSTYAEAEAAFDAIQPAHGERWWLGYSSEYQADLLAVKRLKDTKLGYN